MRDAETFPIYFDEIEDEGGEMRENAISSYPAEISFQEKIRKNGIKFFFLVKLSCLSSSAWE